ncbi:hypothetical protein F2Q68_00027051 [Brassica cretica]|uniref:Uncharacterized protein n=1 Tax=Brassica cretica TaxID=69181 RepID=A0A8S9ICT1_BRACR|nr:hypothetical protein F2Q68_00027051 [Brassica cretica]
MKVILKNQHVTWADKGGFSQKRAVEKNTFLGFLQMSNSDEEETMTIAHLQSIRQRRRPLHSKRRASRDSAAKGKMNSTWDDQEMITEDAGSGGRRWRR